MANYGTGVYGTATYQFVVTYEGVYGAADSKYGSARYSAPVYMSKAVAKFELDTLVKNFPKDYGLVRETRVTTLDPLSAASESDMEYTYNINIVTVLPALSTLNQFRPEQLIESEYMTENFLLLAEVIGPTNDENRFRVGQVLGFVDTQGLLEELDADGVALSYQARFTDGIDQPAQREVSATPSTAAVLDSDGFRILSGKSTTTAVGMTNIFRLANGYVTLSTSIGNGKDSRTLFQPLDSPITITGISKDSTSEQNVTVDVGRTSVKAVEVSLRVGTTAKNATSISVYGSDKTTGHVVHIPAGGTTQRIVTRRFRVPTSSGKLTIKLSDKLSLVEFRVLGTWS